MSYRENTKLTPNVTYSNKKTFEVIKRILEGNGRLTGEKLGEFIEFAAKQSLADTEFVELATSHIPEGLIKHSEALQFLMRQKMVVMAETHPWVNPRHLYMVVFKTTHTLNFQAFHVADEMMPRAIDQWQAHAEDSLNDQGLKCQVYVGNLTNFLKKNTH